MQRLLPCYFTVSLLINTHDQPTVNNYNAVAFSIFVRGRNLMTLSLSNETIRNATQQFLLGYVLSISSSFVLVRCARWSSQPGLHSWPNIPLPVPK